MGKFIKHEKTCRNSKKNFSVLEFLKDINKSWLRGINTLGITSGASSPEILIKEILDFLKSNYTEVEIENLKGIKESITFKPITNFS